MFKFLKDKLKSAISVFSKKVEEEVEETPKKSKAVKKEKKPKAKAEKPKAKEVKADKPKKEKKSEEKKEEKIEEKPEEKGFFAKLKDKFAGEEEAEEKAEEEKEEVNEEVEEKKGFFERVGEVFTTKTLSEGKFEEIFSELEMAMLENNVALSVIEKIKKDMSEKLVNQKLKRGQIEDTIENSLKESIEGLMKEKEDFLKKIRDVLKEKRPCVVCFFGINGSGKTTTIAKLANLLKKNKFTCVLAAADTFRAAAIDQLQKHGDKLGIKVIKQEYGSDAAAVAFDAIEHAKAHRIDVVLIDTAGRSHSNANLMDELAKIMRVTKPDIKVFVGDSLTGNDMVEQAEIYTQKTGIDGIVLAKADVDEKGGAIISVSYVTRKPIYYLGVGQAYDDIEKFDEKKIMKNLFG
jgi:fused signal recognition particle receptor